MEMKGSCFPSVTPPTVEERIKRIAADINLWHFKEMNFIGFNGAEDSARADLNNCRRFIRRNHLDLFATLFTFANEPAAFPVNDHEAIGLNGNFGSPLDLFHNLKKVCINCCR